MSAYINLSKKNLFIFLSFFILVISILYYIFREKNEIIIQKINNFTETKILSRTDTSLQNRHISSYQKIVNEAGYSFEEHKIITEDGYILTAWRIPCLLNESNSDLYKKRQPVILQHGLIDSSYTWLFLDKNHSLVFLLANNGFDVWLTNTRGNAVSFEHENNKEYDSSKIDSKYWNFSFHEMAIYDLPANVNYIKQKTGFDKVDYICHSQGGLIYFIMYTMNSEFIENNFNHFISLGTVITTFTSKSHLIKLGSLTKFPEIVDTLHINNILCFNKFFYDTINQFCKFFNKPCWMQIYNSKRLAKYDYGSKKNLEIYGNQTSPEYDLSKFIHYKVKSLLYTSDKDPFSNFDDLNHLTKYLNEKYVTIKRMNNYNHMDFLWSEDAMEDIYKPIIKFLKYDKR